MGPGEQEATAWARAGLADLCGTADGPPLSPPPSTQAAVADLVADAPVADPLALLGERAALAGLGRRGATSCGGSARLLPAADGWLAVNLARDDDRAAVGAWLQRRVPAPDPWADVEAAVPGRPVADLVARAGLLGLPVAAVGERPPPAEPVLRRRVAPRSPLGRPPLVVDLSALWAGPLCSHLLGLQGARVVKVESTRRPDGGRADSSGFFDLLNHGKQSVALDLPSPTGIACLRRLLAAADVVVEGSRPRALRQWGIRAEEVLAAPGGPRVWVSITGHGRRGAEADRVGFGDDAAAAAGLVLDCDGGPCFVADAVADPLAGVAAARATEAALAKNGV